MSAHRGRLRPEGAPIEAKVKAVGPAAVVGGFIVWLLETLVFGGAVPEPVTLFVYVAVPAGLAYAAAFMAPHTPREDAAALSVKARKTRT